MRINAAMLQFGHGGEAVENATWRPSGPSTGCELQFGHGGEAVENERPASSTLGGSRVFNSATAVKPWRTRQRTRRERRAATLQFGHGGEAVENSWQPQRYRRTAWRASIRPRR